MPPLAIKVHYESGVYRILNKVNNKRYIGSTEGTFKGRWINHRSDLNKRKHVNRHLQSAWLMYGAASFEFQVVERCHPDKCLEREQYWMDKEDVCNPDKGYNILPKAGSPRGREVSQETRDKISKAHTGMKRSEETRAKFSAMRKGKAPIAATEAAAKANKGRKRSQAFCDNLSQKMTGREVTEETRAKVSATKKAQHAADPTLREKTAAKNRGKKHTEEHKAKIGNSHWKNRPDAEEIRAKVSKSHWTNRPDAEEIKAKMAQKVREARLGTTRGPCSKETRQKIALAKYRNKIYKEELARLTALFLSESGIEDES